MYIIVSTRCKRDGSGDIIEETMQDQWEATETYSDARKVYDKWLEDDDLYSASICIAVRSTDYDCDEYRRLLHGLCWMEGKVRLDMAQIS